MKVNKKYWYDNYWNLIVEYKNKDGKYIKKKKTPDGRWFIIK